eukprot:596856-Prymnesium_polylepis.2
MRDCRSRPRSARSSRACSRVVSEPSDPQAAAEPAKQPVRLASFFLTHSTRAAERQLFGVTCPTAMWEMKLTPLPTPEHPTALQSAPPYPAACSCFHRWHVGVVRCARGLRSDAPPAGRRSRRGRGQAEGERRGGRAGLPSRERLALQRRRAGLDEVQTSGQRLLLGLVLVLAEGLAHLAALPL